MPDKYVTYLSLFYIAFGLTFCQKKNVKTRPPTCIEERILAFQKTVCDKGAKVYEYQFQGERVYVFDIGFCSADQSAKVINEDCQEIGTIGGVNGNQDVNGSNFAHAQRTAVVWSKRN